MQDQHSELRFLSEENMHKQNIDTLSDIALVIVLICLFSAVFLLLHGMWILSLICCALPALVCFCWGFTIISDDLKYY